MTIDSHTSTENINFDELKDDFIGIQPDVSVEQILNFLRKYNDDSRYATSRLLLKKVPFEVKIAVLRYSLSTESLSNVTLILNIYNLIKSYNNLGQEFFDNENVIFSSLEEMLDIKLDLKDDIISFVDKLGIWYLSLFRSIHKIEVNFLENVEEIPNVYKQIIMMSDMFTLSGICAKIKSIKLDDFHVVKNAFEITSMLIDKMQTTNRLLKMFTEQK